MTAGRLALVCTFVLVGCIEGEPPRVVMGGDEGRGRDFLRTYGCGECHVIPGVAGADATLGPPLDGWSARQYIAGSLANTTENLMWWIMDPEEVEPGTAMPDLDVTEDAARDMAAYLFTLQPDNPLGPPHLFPVRVLEELGGT